MDCRHDKIDNIYCSDYKIKINGKEEHPIVIIVIKLKQKSKLIITYDLEAKREVAWHQASRDVKLLYDNQFNPFLYENEIGIFNAYDKHTAFEYHVYDENVKLLNFNLMPFGLDWGPRIFKGAFNKYLIGAAKIIMPYNYQNIIQHFQSSNKDIHIDKFYATDYYYLNGSTMMHKFRNNP